MISKARQSEHEQLIDPNFLFRFSVPCLCHKGSWTEKGIQLSKKYLIPSFGELLQRRIFADLRIAWNEDGLLITLRVSGKKNRPWCRSTRIEESDGLQVWIDTRDTHTIHRAGRFCHRFAFLPFVFLPFVSSSRLCFQFRSPLVANFVLPFSPLFPFLLFCVLRFAPYN